MKLIIALFFLVVLCVMLIRVINNYMDKVEAEFLNKHVVTIKDILPIKEHLDTEYMNKLYVKVCNNVNYIYTLEPKQNVDIKFIEDIIRLTLKTNMNYICKENQIKFYLYKCFNH